ncbi:MAG: thiol-disulfide isomerase/thioredoxin [Myxococcota bacterium]|jgi:thiol-disulfide isomerase/thioredoxin
MDRSLPGLLALLLGISAPAAAAYPEMIPLEDVALTGRTAPGIELTTLTGGDFSLEGARADGKVVVLAFWASWCGPCQRELPALKELQGTLSDDVQIVLVNVDKDARDAQRFLRRIDISDDDLIVAMDNEAVALGSYSVLSMPTSFVIDRNGTVKLAKVGYSADKGLSEVEAAIAEALK